MGIDQIIANLQELNARLAKRPAAKKKAAPVKTEVYGEEWLQQAAERIAAALHLEDKGINAEALVTAVHNHEAAVVEVVQ